MDFINASIEKVEREESFWIEEAAGPFWVKEESAEGKILNSCVSLENPCFAINCRHHLRPEGEAWDSAIGRERLEMLFNMKETCCKRLAENRGGTTDLNEIAQQLNLTRRIVMDSLSRGSRKLSGNPQLRTIFQDWQLYAQKKMKQQ